jgi:hypothetical protein
MENKKYLNILVVIHEEKRPLLEDSIESDLQQMEYEAWTYLIWLGTESKGGSFGKRNEGSNFVECGEYFDQLCNCQHVKSSLCLKLVSCKRKLLHNYVLAR